jgi:predicted flap endonuclease-1-like 5' DNA nuclease
MPNLIHIAEVAALLFGAYAVGWAIGYLARRLTIRRPKAIAVIPDERLAAAKGDPVDENALVKAPTIVEVEKAPIPIIASAVPLDAGLLPPVTKASAIETLKGLSATMPLMPAELASTTVTAGASPPVLVPAVAEPIVGTTVSSETPPLPILVEDMAIFTAAALDPVAAVWAEPVVAPTPSPAPSAELKSEPQSEAGPEPEPAPELESEPELDVIAPALPPMPASVPGQAWSGQINGHTAPKFELADATVTAEKRTVSEPVAAAKEAGLDVGLLASLEAELNPLFLPSETRPAVTAEPELQEATLNDALLASVADGLNVDEPEPAPIESVPVAEIETRHSAVDDAEEAVVAVTAEPATNVTFEPVPGSAEPASSEPPVPESVKFDEDAAMRAIEGGWSRRQARAMSGALELSDVTSAVAAAQVAVESVLAQNGVTAERQLGHGKPRGLPRPRNDLRDDLKQINGLSPLDESTLNNLGIYHFDQIAAWDRKEVLWMENHAFAVGRIGREGWQEQARALGDRAALRATR